jgi:nucleoside-diphosphate-sugar epimerase
MKILITGAAGFIGSHVSEKLLEAGHSITGIDNFDPFYSRLIKEKNLSRCFQHENFKFIEGDISNRELFNNISKAGLVIHLAAKAGVRPSIDNPSAYINTNINGTFHLLEWMKKGNCNKMIFASSSSVYGNNSKTPFSESDNVDSPISPYAFSKKSCELLNHTYFHLNDISIINLRFFTVYGPRQRPDLAIHKFFDRIITGNPIQVYGDGTTGRDYTFVDDIVNGVLSAAERIIISEKLYEIINLGNNNPVSLNELIKNIETVLGKKAVREQMPSQEGDVDITFADISLAKKLLDYSPATTLLEGLNLFRSWHENK